MTRETKIGLLVGLAFIIVIGILLSDHFRGTMEAPPAMLLGAAPNVRQAVNVPGSGQQTPPAITQVPDPSPRGQVRTPRDIDPPQGPVVLDNNAQRPPQDGHTDTVVTPPTVGGELGNIARQNGQELIPVDPIPSGPQNAVTSARTYKAGPGDTVSKMAAHFLGANTKLNREAIIRANPSLQDNPNKIVVGVTYNIPAVNAAASPAARAPAPGTPDPTQSAGADVPTSAAAPGVIYTVKAGDNLWKIANSQLNDPGEIDAIKELNRDVLKGGDTVRVGMKLRLPRVPVAMH